MIKWVSERIARGKQECHHYKLLVCATNRLGLINRLHPESLLVLKAKCKNNNKKIPLTMIPLNVQ